MPVSRTMTIEIIQCQKSLNASRELCVPQCADPCAIPWVGGLPTWKFSLCFVLVDPTLATKDKGQQCSISVCTAFLAKDLNKCHGRGNDKVVRTGTYTHIHNCVKKTTMSFVYAFNPVFAVGIFFSLYASVVVRGDHSSPEPRQIGRASCRERVYRSSCRSRWSPYHSSRRRHTRYL